ncbi:family 20 glycosylhydrolase [uncultured Alistipes sp.]|uniref:glycoside hydrolase family 20 protein n=1 Tax=uncultured Alistipes sp. TaxID=538949 RepID=UPI002600E0EE|nr:family 20 glycosylhydrolase [uncultured Alistipes sp.]
MKRLALLLAALLTAALLPASGHPVIPAPASFTEQPGEYRLTSGAIFSLTGAAREGELAQYIASLPFALKEAPRGGALTLRIDPRRVAAEEGYTLEVTPRRINVEARSEAGAFYALQTLLQLAGKQTDGSWRIPCCRVEDAPRFPYRGIMLDVSRNFQSKEFVLKQLDAMAHFKFNRLHFHLTDGAGWRLEIKRYPRLTEFAAWRPYRTWLDWWSADRHYCEASDPQAHGGFYTQEDIREIVEHARRLHITVIPEIEMPGHSEEVLAAYPELSCAGKPYVNSEFCPGNEQTFEFLEGVLTEVMELFPSEYIHIGGDEAGKGAWKSCPKCQARMKAEGIADVDGLQSYLVHRIERFLNDHGRRLLGWDEILDGGLAPNATVMSWRGAEGGLKAIRAGHDAIMTPGEYCYLDYAQDAPFTQPLSIGGYTPLRKVYSFEMSFPELTPEEQARLLGVQANLWTEYIPTPEHVEYMLYPRVLAIAEAGWSLPERRDYDDFRRRALGAVEWLREEGYNPFDLEHEYGERPESLEPKEHLARGKRVEYRTPWHEKYAAAGETTLTDGMIGGWTYGDRRWQGFLNSDVDVTVDLEEPTEVHYVGLTFMQSKGPYVWVPSEVEIYASQDGEHFERLTTVRNDISTECPDLLFKTFAYTGRTSARYLRCVARSNGTPGGWLFLDEIVVL